MNYTHIIITRFSYRFKKDLPVDTLFSEKRMKCRFKLFETFCFPSIIAQKQTNFSWVLIIDPELPLIYKNRLQKMINRFYQSSDYLTHGPRKIICTPWNYENHLSGLNWLHNLDLGISGKKWLITTRLDDDDSLCCQFTQIMYDQLQKQKIQGFLLISYELGHYWYPCQDTPHGVFKTKNQPYIALGLTLITEVNKYPFTIYFGNHTKLVQYIRHYQDHKLLKKLCDANNEPIKNAQNKYTLIRRTKPIYIRTIHDQNLEQGQRNIYKSRNPKIISDDVETILMRFGLKNLDVQAANHLCSS